MYGVVASMAACAVEPPGPGGLSPPRIVAMTVVASPYNVLTAIASARVRDADSVTMWYAVDSRPSGIDDATPMVVVGGDSVMVPVLGLLPQTRYRLRLVAYGPGGVVAGKPYTFTSGALPADLPSFAASGADPSPGFVVFSRDTYALAVDNAGRVVWYRHFPDGAGLAFMAQPTGHYTVRPATAAPGDLEPWLELDPTGRVTRTLSCAGSLQSRLHDLLVLGDGSYWILCDETRTVDLSESGGSALARVTGTVVQHIGPDGARLMHWTPFDHFQFSELDPRSLTGATVNWTHGNAIDLDTDGHVLVSFRNLGEVTKIHATNGAVLWRLGGRANEFTFEGTAMPAFVGQHSARLAARGELVLLDNLGDPVESRLERYLLDERTRRARLTQWYGAAPGVVTLIGGSVQPLAQGRTLVSFGTAGRVQEVDSSGRVTWQLDGHPGYVFRAQRIRSLYSPGTEAHEP